MASNAKDSPSSKTNPSLHRRELRENVRFRIEDAPAKLIVEGFLSSLGLKRASKGRMAVNLSEGGALVIATQKLEPGTRVKILIEMEKYGDKIEATGEVRWCFASAKKATDFYTGIRFLDLPALQKTKISKMREWFMSPEYRQKTAIRKRQSSANVEFE